MYVCVCDNPRMYNFSSLFLPILTHLHIPLQVHYMSTMSSLMRLTLIGQSYMVVDSSLQSAMPIKMAININVSNSQGSIVLYDTFTLPLAPPTCTSSVAIVMAMSVTLQITSTMSTYEGYTVIVNGTKVCVACCHSYMVNRS